MTEKKAANGTALIVGVGDGLSASLARLIATQGYDLILTARNTEKLVALQEQTGAALKPCNAADPESVQSLFDDIRQTESALRVVIYNPSARVRGPIASLDPEAVRKAIEVTAFGAFLVGQQAAATMLEQPEKDGQRGTILFTGASAGIKGFPHSASFAMGKFAQRGLSESMARELHPQGIHVAWINVDGGIRSAARKESPREPDSLLDPDAIAQTYLDLIRQHRSAWTNEIAVRPWVETF